MNNDALGGIVRLDSEHGGTVAPHSRAVLERIEGELGGSGGVVAIEPESGAYFWGATLGQANDAAYSAYPDTWIYFVRTDDPTAEIALPTW